MRLTRLDLHGFKSFFHRTSLSLPPGISAVVGPNGCGKSNIADAIRWVMGEQSPGRLRGRSMEDIIFAGSAANRSLGMAEVSVTAARTDGPFPPPYQHYEELTITRRLYRSGESEYFINKLPCRLKDILHLFMGTGLGNRGYAVIEQGSIGRIIESRPEERRAWIEEAAGVVKFRAQRQAALRKMETTGHNLERVADILAEVQRQANSLKRQAKKAERHRKFTARSRELDLALAALRCERLSRQLTQQQAAEKALSDQKEIILSQESAQSAALEADRLRLVERERGISDLREERLRLGNKIQALEQEEEYLKEKIVDLKQRRDHDQSQSVQEEGRLAELNGEVEALRGRREEAAAELEEQAAQEREIKSLLDQAQEKAALKARAVSGVKDSLIELAASRARANNALVSARERLGSLEARRERLAEQAAESESEQATLEGRLQESEKELERLDASLGELQERKADIQKARLEAEEALDSIEAAWEKARQESRRLAGRLAGLEELDRAHEGLAQGVKTLLTDESLLQRLGERPFLGLVAEGIGVAQELESAVEAALAGGAELLVARDAGTIRDALGHLKSKGAGRAGLLTEALLRPTAAADPPPAGARLLKDELTFTGPSGKAAEALIGSCLLADDLTQAFEAWEADGRRRPVVTRNGEMIAPPGVVSGGRETDPQASLLARQRTIRELGRELAEAESVEAREAERRDVARQDLDRVKSETEELAGQVREAEVARQEVDKEVAGLRIHLKEAARRVEVLGAEAEGLESEQAGLEKVESEQAGLLSEAEARQEELAAELSEAEAEAEAAGREASALSEKMTGLKVVISRVNQIKEQLDQESARLEGDLSRAGERLEALKRQVAEAEEASRQLSERVVEAGEELKDLAVQGRQQETKIGQEEERLAIYQEELNERAAGLKEVREGLRRVEEEANQASLALSETRLSLNHVKEDALERHGVDLSADGTDYVNRELDEAGAKEELARLREKLERLGPVNPTAVEEYQALEERREFLEGQVADLEASMSDLRRAIRKINKTTLERFMETFRSVSAKMEEICPILFGEGSVAQLVLTDPEEPLESGLDLRVQPPGKKLVNMTLLSGGEKALASACLLFAIFLHKPSPFCLLDEVDAPLDESNVERFNGLLRRIGQQSQILMITHNRRTMEVVDSLYGVTMPEPGVSRLVSVNMAKEAARAS